MSKFAGMLIKVPLRDIVIIIIIYSYGKNSMLGFFAILVHFADNLAHPDINLCSGSPAKNNSCSYQIGMEPTVHSLKWPFLWQPVLFGGWGVHTCMSNSKCCWGVRLKRQGFTRILKRTAKPTTARGLFSTLGTPEVRLKFCQEQD